MLHARCSRCSGADLTAAFFFSKHHVRLTVPVLYRCLRVVSSVEHANPPHLSGCQAWQHRTQGFILTQTPLREPPVTSDGRGARMIVWRSARLAALTSVCHSVLSKCLLLTLQVSMECVRVRMYQSMKAYVSLDVY